MAKGDLRIPEQVREDMRERFETRIAKTIAEFASADEDEDVMTGHLGANLTTHSRQVFVPDAEIPGPWIWSLSYRKFRGRGPGATEKRLGADGILEVTVAGPYGSDTKSMLFQSKMEGAAGAKGLVEQCARLTTWREAAAVFSYGAAAFEGLTLDDVLAARGDLAAASGEGLASFLSEKFVGCEVGDTDLSYDAQKKMLRWRDAQRQLVSTQFAAKHRIRIDVKGPKSQWRERVEEINADEISKHRMAVRAEDLLGVDWSATPAEMKAAQKSLTKVYHPDLWQGWSREVLAAMEERTKEIQAVPVKKKSGA